MEFMDIKMEEKHHVNSSFNKLASYGKIILIKECFLIELISN